jgi:hypothetical protein
MLTGRHPRPIIGPWPQQLRLMDVLKMDTSIRRLVRSGARQPACCSSFDDGQRRRQKPTRFSIPTPHAAASA